MVSSEFAPVMPLGCGWVLCWDGRGGMEVAEVFPRAGGERKELFWLTHGTDWGGKSLESGMLRPYF